MENKKYSVLMSVYKKENPMYLKESILSILNQSIRPTEIIIVEDGPLTDNLYKVLDEFSIYDCIRRIALEQNMGLGKALNIGLQNCNNEYIARMDTDDIALPERCEKQLEMFAKDNELTVVGSAVLEFNEDANNPTALKMVKESHEDIGAYIKYRNPINHPTVMFKKSAVEQCGGYQEWLYNEDYYLWIRLFLQGEKFANIKEPLLKMRINSDTYMRRAGYKYFITQKRLFKYMKKNGLINLREYVFNNVISFFIRVVLSNKLRKFVYISLLRKKGAV